MEGVLILNHYNRKIIQQTFRTQSCQLQDITIELFITIGKHLPDGVQILNHDQ